MIEPLADLLLADSAATEALGARLAIALRERKGWVIYLRGELGVGKTTLARAFLHALGVEGTIRSPTYTLIEPYDIDGRSVLHLDLYRLNHPAELEQLGLGDTPPQAGGWLVEWPERGGDRLPAPDLEFELQHAGEYRRLICRVAGKLRDRIEPMFENSQITNIK